MKLIIFPGGSDPNHKSYKDVYGLIRHEAKKRNFSNVLIPTYPGHKSHNEDGEITVSGAVIIIRSTIEKAESEKEDYIVVARSFGCFPLLDVLKKMKTNYLKKAILWGASSFYEYYKQAVIDFDENYKYALAVGTKVSKDIFKEIYPIELSINELNHINYPLMITSGSEDTYHSIQFHNFLKSIKSSPNVSFPNLISGVDHSVHQYDEDYINLLLGY